MPSAIIGRKTFDDTLSRIATRLHSEFHLQVPPFLNLISPQTQCFHYYGRKYFKKLFADHPDMRGKIQKALKTVLDVINCRNLGIWYHENLTPGNRVYLDKTFPPENEDATDMFIDMLVNTPISCNYAMSGEVYHTGVPRFYDNKSDFQRYSGMLKLIPGVNILGDNEKAFAEIITALEKVFLYDLELGSAIMVPLS